MPHLSLVQNSNIIYSIVRACICKQLLQQPPCVSPQGYVLYSMRKKLRADLQVGKFYVSMQL